MCRASFCLRTKARLDLCLSLALLTLSFAACDSTDAPRDVPDARTDADRDGSLPPTTDASLADAEVVSDAATPDASMPEAFGGGVVHMPIADALVREAQPDDNFGQLAYLSAASSPAVTSFVRFRVEHAGVVKKAVLQLRVRNASADGIELYRANGAWFEESVTWNSQPERGALLGRVSAASAGDLVEIDVSEYVTKNGYFNFSLVGNGPDNLALKSRETDEAPKLVVYSVVHAERLFDSESATYYYLTRVPHEHEGALLKLAHAQAVEQAGETIPAFAARMGNPQLAINASMGQVGLPEGTREPVGIQIVDGEILQEVPTKTKVFTLGIKDDNELVAYPFGTKAQDIVNDGIQNALTAFVPLIVDHEPVTEDVLKTVKNLSEKNPRQVIAQFDNLDLMILSCGGRGIDGEGMTALDLIRVLEQHDVKFAFNLDGGGSVATAVNGRLITKPIDGNGTLDRPRPNFLFVR